MHGHDWPQRKDEDDDDDDLSPVLELLNDDVGLGVPTLTVATNAYVLQELGSIPNDDHHYHHDGSHSYSDGLFVELQKKLLKGGWTYMELNVLWLTHLEDTMFQPQ